jgi:hypothetical protein
MRQLISDIVYPTNKKEVNSRSLGYLKLALMSKQNSVLFATFPKAGWNWTADILSYTLIKYCTGKYDVEYQGSGSLKERERKPFRLFAPSDSRALFYV